MKKQFIIEVTETTHPYEVLYTPETYPAPGFYLNTTPNGHKQLMLNPNDKNYGVMGIYDNQTNPELINHFKPVPAADEAPQVLQVSGPAATVTNDELLQFIAVANNPDLVTEIIKTKAALRKTDE